MNHHDYTLNGMYFITICVQNHRCVFGRIENGKMITNSFGQIAHEQWCELSNRFPNVYLDAFIIMPNHMHGILGKLWQRGYYDHVIRNYIEYETITNYIANNPLQWNNDKFFHP